jgi:peptidyl-prolyl cis-trans isomerase A (cyclophilin A)
MRHFLDRIPGRSQPWPWRAQSCISSRTAHACECRAQARVWRASFVVSFLALVSLLRCASTSPGQSNGGLQRALPAREERCLDGAPAPDLYRARVTTSKGAFVIEVHRDWAPLAADHFYELVCARFYSQARFYRVVKGFVVQFGMNADPAVHQTWQEKKLKDEPARTSNKRGMVSFAGSAARDSRTTHVFINLANNEFLDTRIAPFGFVSSGMEVVDSIHSGYGENAPMGKGPEQNRLWKEGNRYLLEQFPDLDYIIDVTIES